MALKLKMIMSYLPVLKVNKQNSNLNSILKSSYDTLIQDLITISLDQSVFIQECYELSLLSFCHPIFDEKQKSKFKNYSLLLRNAFFKSNNSPSNSFSSTHSNSIQNQNKSNPVSKLNELEPSLNRSSGFYNESFDQDQEFNSFNNSNRNMSQFAKEHNYFVDDNERSSSLNVSLHMQSSNSNDIKSESKINEETPRLEATNPNGQRKHPPLKSSTSLPVEKRFMASNESNYQNSSLPKGLKLFKHLF
jgi:hypothetical protein